MTKVALDIDNVFPISEEALKEDASKIGEINKIAIRRGRVRELVRMGYEPHQIVLILDKGIKVGNVTVKVPLSETIIKSDMDYIRQEDVASVVPHPEKRAEILDKLKFLYNQAIRQYLDAKGAIKNSFLNTALSILNKMSEIEGIELGDATNPDINEETKLTNYATEFHKLGKDEQSTILTAIREVLGKRRGGQVGNNGVSNEPPAIPTSTNNDEGVSGKS